MRSNYSWLQSHTKFSRDSLFGRIHVKLPLRRNKYWFSDSESNVCDCRDGGGEERRGRRFRVPWPEPAAGSMGRDLQGLLWDQQTLDCSEGVHPEEHGGVPHRAARSLQQQPGPAAVPVHGVGQSRFPLLQVRPSVGAEWAPGSRDQGVKVLSPLVSVLCVLQLPTSCNGQGQGDGWRDSCQRRPRSEDDHRWSHGQRKAECDKW